MTTPQPVSDAARALLAETTIHAAACWFFEKFLLPHELDAAWTEAALQPTGQQLFETLLDGLGVVCDCQASDLHRVPRRGPVVAVANHPFGMVEGVILGSLLLRVRPDVKFLANSMLSNVPGLGEYVFPVNTLGGAAKENWRSLRQSIDWVKKGGMLVVFPAGEVSSLRLSKLEISDSRWDDKVTRIIQMAGAYRLAGTDVVPDLYTTTLFRFREGLLANMNPALELGRSFVRIEYQKSFLALLLLWKGIGRYVARNPRYRKLFGPESISRAYSEASRALIVAYLQERCANRDLARFVEPRRRFRAPRLRGCDPHQLANLLDNVEELCDAVADLEPDGKGLPVLLRQYLKCGGEMLAFNVDSAFSDVVEGLVIVDLVKMSRPQLEKYLGKEGTAGFLRVHTEKKQIM